MGSSRLPGKVIATSLGMTMLERLLVRLQSVQNVDEIIVATTKNSQDDTLVELIASLGIKYFRGSEHDVFRRVIDAATFVGADAVVEITGDCPLIDPILVEQMIQIYLNNSCDYLSNCETPSFVTGMEIQVVSLDALRRSYSMTNSDLDREHVTLHIRKNPKFFNQIHIIAPIDLRYPDFSVTLDEQSDLDLISAVIENLEQSNPLFGCREIIEFLKKNEKIAALNKGVIRKGDT
jgi:spore coat polysaccharide biosynthesis protein SpsF